jgi:hypothetical protein
MSRRKLMVKRESNGRIQREPQLPPASEVRRLRDAAMSGLRDPVWGTELGRLYLVGKISAGMYAAGKRWAELAVKYSQALCSPSPDPRAICLDRMGGSITDPDSAEGRREVRRHERAVASFLDAHVALKAVSGPAERTVRSLCERGEMLVGHASLMDLSQGLVALAGFWGLTDSSKSMSDRQV